VGRDRQSAGPLQAERVRELLRSSRLRCNVIGKCSSDENPTDGAVQKGKDFFFKKKKQKTFVVLSHAVAVKYYIIKSFLVLFFKKEHTFFVCLGHNFY
jgi:hypothetical protein